MQQKIQKYLIIGLVLILVAGAGMWFFSQDSEEEIPIKSDFGSKVVYTTNTDQDSEKFIKHCGNQGGVFNECGTICEPGVDMCATVCAFTCEQLQEEDNEEEEQEEVWSSYINRDFDFSLKYPENDWNKYMATSTELSSKFNFYIKPSGVPLDLPLTHFVNISNVSIFPEGIATEGLVGETKDLNLDVGFDISEESKLYTLEDGTPFAAYIKPVDYPESWTENGFIWIRTEIQNLETSCLKDGEEVDNCDPLADQDIEIVRKGEVDQELWEKQIQVLKSFSFLGESIEGQDFLLENPQPEQEISSPLKVKGQVSGAWFFEASFPVVLTDWDGKIIAEAVAEAQEDWMTTDFVPFEATLQFDKPYEEGADDFMKKGNLILQKSNPSGLPENDDAYEIRVQFE